MGHRGEAKNAEGQRGFLMQSGNPAVRFRTAAKTEPHPQPPLRFGGAYPVGQSQMLLRRLERGLSEDWRWLLAGSHHELLTAQAKLALRLCDFAALH